MILLATRSPGKLRELRPLFAAAGFAVLDLEGAGIVETEEEHSLEVFETFEENALAKARFFFRRSGGLPTIADDSGLEVAALGGQPGVWSKRWSGRVDLTGRELDEANNAMLLQALASHTHRAARYVCVAAYVDASRECAMRGVSPGRILSAPRGSAGFGYDPLFESAELGKTFAEVDGEAKTAVSHRGRAFRSLIASLTDG